MTIRGLSMVIADYYDDINALQDELDMVSGIASAPSIAKYTGMPSAHGGNISDTVSAAVCRMDDINHRISTLESAAMDLQLCLVQAITAIVDASVARKIIYARYVDYRDYDSIADQYGYTTQYIRNMCAKWGRATIYNNNKDVT